MKDNYDDLLPIGSVCTLKDNKFKVMICGYFNTNKEKKKIYTYFGVNYPYGIIDEKHFVSFNDDDIIDVVYEGYRNYTFEFLKAGMNIASKEQDN